MKKNKFTFLLATSFLVVSALAGCNKQEEPSGDNNTVVNSNASISSQTDISSNIPSGNSSGDSSIPSGNSSSSSSSSSSSHGGGSQEQRVDWSQDEKNAMSAHLYGVVLPFVAEDVYASYNTAGERVLLEGTVAMDDTVLAKYASKFSAADGWEGGDISSEFGQQEGIAYSYQRPVTQNGVKRYIKVNFTGIEEHEHSATTMSKNGKFYLEAFDPYEYYEYPTRFVSEWLNVVYGTDIIPPSFDADYYDLVSDGVLAGRSDTNIEESYKTKLESDSNFTVESSKNTDGYYVAHPSDLAYVLLFKYDTASKMMMLKVEEPRGWKADVINDFLTKYNLTSLVIPAIDNPNIGFRFKAVEDTAGEEGGIILASHMTLEMAQAYVNNMKTAGYIFKDDVVTAGETAWYSTAILVTDDGTYSVIITYDQLNNDGRLTFTFGVTSVDKTRVKSWPGAAVAARINATQDSVPAFTGDNLGFVHLATDSANTVMVYLSEGGLDAAKTAYIAKLTENYYVAYKTTGNIQQFRSQNNEILVSVLPISENGQTVLAINVENFPRKEWPTNDIANAIKTNVYGGQSMTDTVPALNVDLAESCYVNTNLDGEFEIYIGGLASSLADYKKVFTDNNWIDAPYYRYSATQKGVLVSPNKQLVAYFSLDGNNISILISGYSADDLKVVGLSDGNAATDDWDYNNSNIGFVDATDPEEVARGMYQTQVLFSFDVSAGDAFKISNGVDWYGYLNIPEVDKPNESDFTTDSDKNIVAVKDGKVNLYLKVLNNGSKTIYVAYAPVILPWPGDELATFFGDVFTTIPEIENENASFAISDTEIDTDANRKTVYITVTVANANSAKAYAISQLETNYNYSLDTVRNVYVSSDEGLPIVGFNSVGDNSFILYMTYIAPSEPEPDGYPTDDIASWLSSFHATDTLPNIHLENVEYTTDVNDEGCNVLVYTPTGSNTVDNIETELLAIFDNVENEFLEGDPNFYTSKHGDFSIEIIKETDDVKAVFYPSGITSIYPSAKLSQYLDGCTVAETLANFSLDGANYEWYWPTEVDPYGTLNIYKTGYVASDYNNLLEDLVSQLKQEGFVERYFEDFDLDVLVSPNRDYCLCLYSSTLGVGIDVFNFADLESPATLFANYALKDSEDWILNNDAVFYAWVWGPDGGDWYQMVYDDVEDCFYIEEVPDSANGIKIYRYNPEGPVMVFDGASIWNNTGDIVINGSPVINFQFNTNP